MPLLLGCGLLLCRHVDADFCRGDPRKLVQPEDLCKHHPCEVEGEGEKG